MILRVRNVLGEAVAVRVIAVEVGNKTMRVLAANGHEYRIPTAWAVW